MYRMLNTLVNLLVVIIVFWTILVCIEELTGINIIFPFSIVEAELVPHHRWQSLGIAVLLTFSYFSVLHLLKVDREYSPLYFLEVYLKVLTAVGLVIFYRASVVSSEYLVILFFAFYSIVMHLARKKRYKYFYKR